MTRRRTSLLECAVVGTLALVLVGATVLLARQEEATASPSAPAQVDDAPEGTTTTTQPPRDDSIIIKPGEGQSPDDAGDRGGALQISLFLAVVVGVAGVGALGLREARRNRVHQGTP